MINHFDLNGIQWFMVAICGLLVGFSKTGINGVGMLAIPLMAQLFGGKNSAAVMLPMLIVGDMFAIKQYRQHTKWNYIWKLAPWTLIGLVLGLFTGNLIKDQQFKEIIAISVLVCLGIMLWMELKKGEKAVPHQLWFAALLGLAGGFTTMIGNAAGPVMTIYFLSMQLPKYEYIGTGAWFFGILNLLKLPLQIIFWGSINWNTLMFDGLLIPAIAIGAYLGVKTVKHIPEKPFRWIVLGLAGVSAIRLFF